MALPSDLTTITVTATYESITGTPLTGQVNFSLTTPVQDSTGKVIFNAFTQSATLNSAGFMSVVLPCTDNADLNPTNFSYLVTEVIQGLGRAYYVQLPHTLGSTVDLSALAPVSAPPAATAFASANTWTATQTYSGNPGLKITTGAASGDVLTSDGSGNATWQAPTGGAQIGGDLGGTSSAPQVISTHLSSALPLAQGGTGQATAAAAYNALSPMTTLGDIEYESGANTAARLAGNATSTKKFLTQTGTGSVSAAPAWNTVAAADLPAATTSVQGAVILDGTAADIQPDGVAAAGAKGQAADAEHVHPYQAWQFLPEAYGAKGDGKVIGDAVLASNTTLTSATAGFTSADTGKHIMIHGAQGTTSGPLITTITFVSATTVTLGSAASVTGTGYPAVYGTDDTSAINSAVTAAGNYATANQYFAEVVFAAKVYVLASGPTQTGNGSTTPTFNSQIPLPYPNANGTTQKLVIALTGAGDNGYCQYWESTTPDVAGTALVSMVTAPSSASGTFGNQSVIGGPTKGGAGFTGTFANVKVIVKGIGVWCPIFTNIWAYDFSGVSAMRAERSAAQIFAPSGVNGGAQPYLQTVSAPAFTGSIGTGWRTPLNGNNDDITMDDVNSEGYECAYRLADHFNGSRMAAIYSDVVVLYDGSGDTGTSHGIYIQSISAEVYNVGLDATGGTAQVDITWDAETSTPTADVSDSGNRLFGTFRFRDPANARFPVVSGAGNLAIVCDQLGPGHWSGAPAAPSSASSQQNTAWRNAWITLSATTGITVISVDGTTTGLTAGNNVSVAIRVPSGKSYAVTYTGVLTTTWWLD